MKTLPEREGGWVPLRDGMPVPLTGVQDNPLLHICFNEGWQPYILSALKLLCRPEAYVGDLADIRTAVGEAHTLMGLVENGCGVTDWPINWYLDISAAWGNMDGDAWINPSFGVYPGGVGWAKYDLVMWGTGYGGFDITIIGRDLATGDHVGGHFASIDLRNQSDPAGQTFALDTIDCLNNNVAISGFTPQLYSGDYQSIRLFTGNITVYWMRMLIEGDWLCAGV